MDGTLTLYPLCSRSPLNIHRPKSHQLSTLHRGLSHAPVPGGEHRGQPTSPWMDQRYIQHHQPPSSAPAGPLPQCSHNCLSSSLTGLHWCSSGMNILWSRGANLQGFPSSLVRGEGPRGHQTAAPAFPVPLAHRVAGEPNTPFPLHRQVPTTHFHVLTLFLSSPLLSTQSQEELHPV